MNDQELRQMIRESIARHTAAPVAAAVAQGSVAQGFSPAAAGLPASPATAPFTKFPLRSGDDDGACVIEPAVRCNHCGYCLSYGH